MLWKKSGGVSEEMSWDELMKNVTICLLAVVPGIMYHYLCGWASDYQRRRELQEENDDRIH